MGSAVLPMQRFLPAAYDDGIQSIRKSAGHSKLPSAREISAKIHRDKDQELHAVTLMFMQWGQFIDHDVTSVVKTRGFNGTVPRCCDLIGRRALPEELSHPACLPIEVPENDRFFEKSGVRCMEFTRSAPTANFNCHLGWREQINQVTSFLDASMIYGSDAETAEAIRTFRNGNIIYGRLRRGGELMPPDPPGGELCKAGALTVDCLQPGDGRLAEQPGLTSLHIVWVRYHNRISSDLARLNLHWSDEKIFQETRKIVYSLIQHVTYREFLPILLGPDVIRLFDLELLPKGYYKGYNSTIDPTIANAFSSAAYRFGHSMVQNSFIRTDHKHRLIFNNVSLHDELANPENIWSFGLDLIAINIQRGRDHGIPAYSAWREPCGLAPLRNWKDLEKVFNLDTLRRFRKVYRHVDDIDLFSGGLAEKPIRGAVVGPTFACIIAQQFSNLRRGDRFWYENADPSSSFTPAQLQQIRKITFSSVLCHTMDEIQTIQPFAFIKSDDGGNRRVSCNDRVLRNLDLTAWIETDLNAIKNRAISRQAVDPLDDSSGNRKRLTKLKYRRKKKPNVVRTTNKPQDAIKNNINHDNHSPLEVNIKIQYFPTKTNRPASSDATQKIPPNAMNYQEDNSANYPIVIQTNAKPQFPNNRPTGHIDYNNPYDYYRPTQMMNRPTAEVYDTPIYRPAGSSDYDEIVFEDKPFSSSSNKPYKPITDHFLYEQVYTTKKPIYHQQDAPNYNLYHNYNEQVSNKFNVPNVIYSTGVVHRVEGIGINDKLDFKSRLVNRNTAKKDEDKFVKISSIKSHAVVSASSSSAVINAVLQREGDGDIVEVAEDGVRNGELLRLVELDVSPGDVGNWLYVDEKENLPSNILMPNMDFKVRTSDEIPRPLINKF
ncbi:unnamed protein product [Phyllotreta striolata]|uniref:Uncharacterized protein n=1 Tax=Phyllotreta striolata TaxID=444603 RepID=A0A9N9TJB6_PHYSR|nr:unnamed protein product [Phyllotreta striolata]